MILQHFFKEHVTMPLSKERIIELVKNHGKTENDTGAVEVQIAILSERIGAITQHLQTHKKDNHTRYGLLKLVGQRRSLLDYLKSTEIERYRNIIKTLNIRKYIYFRKYEYRLFISYYCI